MHQVRLIDNGLFTPGKIIGVGLNYAEHISEMNSKRSQTPVIFLKPNSALCSINEPIAIPLDFGSVHHEIELAVLLGGSAFNIKEEQALNYVAGYGLALDLTLRDVQLKAKQKGHPWAIAKGFKNACPVSDFFPKEQVKDVQNLELRLTVNGQLRQQGNTNQMLFTIPELIAYVSRFLPIEAGDILLTGTPAGVGPLKPGDVVEAEIAELVNIQTKIVSWDYGSKRKIHH